MMRVRTYGTLLAAAVTLWGCGEQDDGESESATAEIAAQQAGAALDGGRGVPLDAGAPVRADGGARDAAVQADAASASEACAALTYESFGRSFMQKYCVGCHQGAAAPDGIDLTTLGGVQADKREIDAHAVRTPRSKPMPPPGLPQPSADERKKLGDWLRCGPN